MNLSGFEISSPAVDQMKMPYELLDPPGRGTTYQPALDYPYPTVPLPQDAGGPNGIAPVFAGSITWTAHGWSADHSHFDTAGAMHTANEFIWFHSDEISGSPPSLSVDPLRSPAHRYSVGGAPRRPSSGGELLSHGQAEPAGRHRGSRPVRSRR